MIELYLVPGPRFIADIASDAVVDTHCNWQVSDVLVKCDAVKVDTGVANAHAKLTQEGGTVQ
eukprot:12842885-Prorocentrum_lima.AAC.1